MQQLNFILHIYLIQVKATTTIEILFSLETAYNI
nr:MAG TPA: hypothetical protein [Caudoviricetes sp.]